MGMNAVQLHVKNLVDGLKSPLYERPLVAYITPPNPGKLPGPAAYVWVTNGNNVRRTAPRGFGFRKTSWTVSIWLMSPDRGTNPNADSAFAALVDAVVEAFVTATMPIPLTDSVTGRTSQLLAIGEQFTIEQAPVHSLQDQRLLMYEALIQLTVEEDSQP